MHVWEEPSYDDFQFSFDFLATLITDMKDKQAILTYLPCSASVAYMHQFVGKSLEGACQNIRETCYGSKGYQCWAIVHYLDGSTGAITDYPHQVFQATLRDSSIYVLDLSSAQHSHYEPVVPWAQYQQQQLVRVYSKKLLESFEKNLRDVNERDLSANSTVRIVLDQTAKCFEKGVDDWLKGWKLTIAQMEVSFNCLSRRVGPNSSTSSTKEVGKYLDYVGMKRTGQDINTQAPAYSMCQRASPQGKPITVQDSNPVINPSYMPFQEPAQGGNRGGYEKYWTSSQWYEGTQRT